MKISKKFILYVIYIFTLIAVIGLGNFILINYIFDFYLNIFLIKDSSFLTPFLLFFILMFLGTFSLVSGYIMYILFDMLSRSKVGVFSVPMLIILNSFIILFLIWEGLSYVKDFNKVILTSISLTIAFLQIVPFIRSYKKNIGTIKNIVQLYTDRKYQEIIDFDKNENKNLNKILNKNEVTLYKMLVGTAYKKIGKHEKANECFEKCTNNVSVNENNNL